jgi:hypothetical protein
MINLAYGLRDVIPDDARGAVGMRMIVTQDGLVDIVWDRCDAWGNFALLEEHFPIATMRKVIQGKLFNYEILTRENKVHTLFADGPVTFLANAQDSGGYLYVSGWIV